MPGDVENGMDRIKAMAAVLRPVEARDVAAIATIYGHYVRHGTASFETEAPDETEMGRRRRTLAEQEYPYLVAERDGIVVGYSYASAYRPRAAYRNTVENSVYLRPDCVGQGVGSLLLGGLIAACTERGYRQMIAVVGGSDNEASIRLHRRLGFELVGTLRNVGHKHGLWLDTTLLQRSL